MRNLILLVSLASLMACTTQNSSPAEPGMLVSNASNAVSDEQDPSLSTFVEVPKAVGETVLLSGDIGYYPVVMYLDITHETLSGHYFYTKKGKSIDLRGKLNGESDHWTITEYYHEKPTGYLDLKLGEGSASGQWSAMPDMTSPLEITLQTLDVPYEPNAAVAQRINGRYIYAHTITSYEGLDEKGNDIVKEVETKDEMAVRYIGGGVFSFYLSVLGRNFHTGEVYGLGKMKGESLAATDMDDCQLNFDFSKPNIVDVEEVDCGDYHGANAYFGISLTKKLN
jgi:hypothetical protein